MQNWQKKLFGVVVFDRKAYAFAVAVVLLFGFDLLAIKYSLYFHNLWLDIPVHAAGGFLVALMFYWLFFSNQWTHNFFGLKRGRGHLFTVMVFWVLLVAGAWEAFEFAIGRTYPSPVFVSDTLLDIIVTTVGGLVAWVLVKVFR